MNEATVLQEPHTKTVIEAVRDEWLLFETVMSESIKDANGERPTVETLLQWNGLLAGGAKFILRRNRQLCLRAELPWSDERNSDEARDAAALGMAEGYELWVSGTSPLAGTRTTALPDARLRGAEGARPNDATAQLFHDLTTESGWTFADRPDGTLVADLEVASGLYQAQCDENFGSGYRLFTELAVLESVTAASNEAIAVFLLLAGGAVRWARPAVVTTGSRSAAVFEVLLPASPSPADVADALSSLSVASQHCAEAIKALFSETTARDYLEVGGWGSPVFGIAPSPGERGARGA